jgi:hypothetical protein
MSIDLNQLFAEAALDGPVQRLDCDYIVRRGRRARARRRATVGATTVVGAGVVVLAGATLSSNIGSPAAPSVTTGGGPSATLSPTITPKPIHSASTKEALSAVTLQDPAPGFPYRHGPDEEPHLSSVYGSPGPYLVRLFRVGTEPAQKSMSSAGVGGSEVVVLVGDFPLPSTYGAGQTVFAHPEVAGVTGTAITGREKGRTFVQLFFKSGRFSADLVGWGVTTEQLVAVGNALTGLD